MKLVAIGDIHALTIWKDIIQKEFDPTNTKVVFMGDYFDTYYKVPYEKQILNFNEIAELKSKYPNNVVILFGNHDFHYMPGIGSNYQCSGYNASARVSVEEALRTNMNNIQPSFTYNNKYLFTHAGVTKTWMEYTCNYWLRGKIEDISSLSVDEKLEILFRTKPTTFGFSPGNLFDYYGDEICQTPIWVRPKSLRKDKIDGYIQIIGHTSTNMIDINDSVIQIDSLEYKNYLVIEDDVLIAKSI